VPHRVPDVLAAVDLGSNSFHMIVARIDDGVRNAAYTIIAGNSGPSDVPGATVADSFPAELLGVNDGASEQEMDRAFRRLSLELHPDRRRAEEVHFQ